MSRRKKASARPPPCEPKPKRIRLDSETFCERATRSCRRDELYIAAREPKWDTRMLLVVGIVGLLVWAQSESKAKPPPELGPGGNVPNPIPSMPRQQTLPL